MARHKKTQSKRYDYLPNRANKYSIRRFTVGTTSILIGATLVFGLDHQDANAAETTSTTSSTTTSSDPATTTNTSTASGDTSSSSTATSTTAADTSTANTTQSTASDTSTASGDTSSSSTATSTTANTTQSTASDTSTASGDTSSLSTATSTTTSDTSTANTTQTTASGTSTISTDTSTSSTANSTTATDTSTANTTQSTATNTSTTSTDSSPSSSTTSSTTASTITNLSLMSTAAPMTATAVAPATTDVVAETSNIIYSDAIANGYIKSATDATNAANTLSGRAWLVDTGTPATMANGLTAVPEGTLVYMQWIDTDGAVSPIYQANTTNQLSSVDGSQVGPGAYAFDLREPWVDANGVSHTYRAIDGQYYRLWINDFTTANGNTATMLRQAGGFYPDTFVNSVTSSNLGQFPLIGTNMQRTGIYMAIVPTNDYMTTKNWIVDNQGALTNPATTTSVNDFISGKVWLESGAGDYANSATGPNYNAPSDIAGAGYQVVMSSLTAEGAKAYDAYVNSLPKDQQTAAARALLEANPQYISATVTGYTNANGDYTLRFPSGTLDLNHVYGYVLDPQGNLVKSYSSFTSPLFRAANANLSFTPQTSPYVRPVRNAWVNVNFAVVESTLTDINITNYDVTANPAQPGDVAYVDVMATVLSPLPTYVEWRDSAGNVVQRSGQVTTIAQAEAAGTFTIPADATSGEIYTVYIVSGGNDIAADSLIVQIDQNAALYQPTYTSTIVSQGQTLVVNAPLNSDGQALPTGTSYESGNNVPTWASINPDGSITISPDASVPVGSYNIPVVVTYPDGSRETIYAPVDVKAPDASVYNPTASSVTNPYGTATTNDQIIDNVIVPGYPISGPQPVITVNDPATLPDGMTPGTVDVAVTVTYPDGSIDQLVVPVTTGQPQATQFEPTAKSITNPYGTATTTDQVISNVSIPGYPISGPQPVITVNDPALLPDGKTPGTVNVPVTVTYPDGSVDQITVPVTTGVSQATTYEPAATSTTNPYGTATTTDQVISNVSIPGYPTTGQQPVITVNDPSTLPDGTTPGTVNVAVTVTYPDGTTDQIFVPVTTGQPQAVTYEPVGDQVNNPFGTPTTETQITDAVIIPGYPTTGPQPVITVDDPSTLPDGQTVGTVDVPVTVTYPDGSKDQITVSVTTGDTLATQYDPTASPVFNPYGTPTTEQQVLSNVTVPNYPTTNEAPTYTLANGAVLPDGTQSGTFNVPVTVTYPDGSMDTIAVPVTIGDAQATTYEPSASPVSAPYGTPTTENDVTSHVAIPGYPTTGVQPIITVDNPTSLPDGTTPGTYNVPVTVTYPDGSVDHISVQVNVGDPLATQYDPVATPVSNPYGTPTTEAQVFNHISIPNYPSDVTPPTYTLANGAILPDGTQSGTFNVPVVVTYPDGSVDTINVPVTVGDAQAVTYDPTASPISNPYGTPTTEQQVLNQVTVPGFPTNGPQPTYTLANGAVLPDGTQSGTYEVPVKVTYPDGTTDIIDVPVTVGDAQATQYDPTTTQVDKPYGSATSEIDVISHVSVPNYPSTEEQPVITVDDPSTLPDGTTPGNYNVPVTVTYPDGSVDHVSVPVTVGPTQATTYQPSTTSIEKSYGTSTSLDEVIGHVTIPEFPTTGAQPVITVDNQSFIPDGTIPGTYLVPVTVTYPDGSQDHINVTVNVAPSNAASYDPIGGIVSNPYGTATTEAQVVDNVTIPGYSTTDAQPVITVDNPSLLPDGTVTESVNVPVTVTYPDGSTDHLTVTVTTGDMISNQYDPITTMVDKPYGTPTTIDEVVTHVSVPDYPTTGPQPTFEVINPNSLPSGYTSGTFEVPVLVTYPDGSTDTISVPVTVGTQPQNSQYEPAVSLIEKPYGTPTTDTDVIQHVIVPGYPSTGSQPIITVDDPSQLPDGTTSGSYEVPVTVTYPDGTTDHINVPIIIGEEPQNRIFEPTSNEINKPYGTPTTAEEVINNVMIPGYQTNEPQPVITVDQPDILPDGSIPGTYEVPVTITYPDGTSDKIIVTVTVNDMLATEHDPVATPVENPYGTPTTEAQVIDHVSVPSFSTTGEQPVITVDNSTALPNGTISGTVEVPVTITYPDGSVDQITVPVTTGDAQATTYEPVSGTVNNPYGTPTTEAQVIDEVTIPNYSTTDEQPTVTVNNPSTLPDGTVPGTVEVPVTITYPDGSVDQITVPVTTGDAQATTYEPVSGTVNNPYGTPTTEAQVIDEVTIPNYSTTDEQPIITVDDPSLLPNGTMTGSVDIPVTITYPDGTVDHTIVTVVTGDTQATQYEPTAKSIETPYGTPTTQDQILTQVSVPNFPTTGEQPTYAIPEGVTLPDGTQTGTFEVPVNVTYPDGSQDQVIVTVTVGESQATTYEPTPTPVDKPYGTPTTVEDIVGNVTIPNYPTTGDQPTITVDYPGALPDGAQPGTYEVPVTVTYPDGSQDQVIVTVTVGESQATTYEPTPTPVDKPYGTPTTVEDIVGNVTIPNYPTTGDQPTITVDNPGALPDGAQPGTYEVPVTVTYPDGSQDHVIVKVTVDIAQAEKNHPEYNDGIVKPGETIDLPQIGDTEMPNGTHYDVTPTVPSGWEISVNETTGALSVTPPKNAQTGTSIVTEVIVHYPDGSTEVVQIVITVGEQLPTPNCPPIDIGDQVIDGHHATPGHTICVTWDNGTTSRVPVSKDGTWHVAIPSDIQSQAINANIVEVDHKGHVSQPTMIKKGDVTSKMSQHELPDTGQDSNSKPIILGGLFAALGSLLLFRRKRKDKASK